MSSSCLDQETLWPYCGQCWPIKLVSHFLWEICALLFTCGSAGICCNTGISLIENTGEARSRRCKLWWNKRWGETNEGGLHGMRDEMGWGQGKGSCHKLGEYQVQFTLETNTILNFLCSSGGYKLFQFRKDSLCQAKTVPVFMHQYSWQCQTSAQLGKSNLTHLWNLFKVDVSTDGEMLLQCK